MNSFLPSVLLDISLEMYCNIITGTTLAWFHAFFVVISNFIIYETYVSVKSKLQHPPPPRATPGHLTFLKIIVQIPPYLGQNAVQMPHTMVHLGDQMPPPRGRFTGTKLSEGRRKRLQLSNKIFINITKLRNTVSVFTKNKSLVQSGGNRCYKVTEGSEFLRVSCNIQSVL